MPKTIVIPAADYWDAKNEEFIYKPQVTLVIEHSLVSLSKWESKWHKPFLSKQQKTTEEIIDYIRCMTITQNVSPDVYYRLSNENVQEINDYIDDPMTATWFRKEESHSTNHKVVTNELIYYWMVTLQIPWEAQKWHLNRLLTLIKVCQAENKPQKNMKMNDVYRRNASLNAARRSKYHSKG